MSVFVSNRVSIIGMASAVPSRIEDVDSYRRRFSAQDIYTFSESTGVNSVHIVGENQTASDLGYAAASYLLDRVGVNPADINILIYSSLSPDYRRPATAGILQSRLGLPNTCCAFDVGLACSGFVYSDQIISSMLSSSDSEYALLIVAESPSLIVDQANPMSMQFGDAGAAILYKKTDSDNRKVTFLYTEGDRFKTLILPAGGFRDMNPPLEKVMCSDGHYRSKYDVYTDGVDFFSFATRDVIHTVEDYLEYIGTAIDSYDGILLHQANKMVLQRFVKKLGIPSDKLPISLSDYGNTSGVSIPLTICKSFSGAEVGREYKFLAVGFGTGLSWGITSFNVDSNCIFPIQTTDERFEEGIIDLNTM